jgi:hypothetical protein
LYDKAKSIGVIVGIVISIFLIGQQVGTLTFLMRLMGGLVDNSNKEMGHIWVVDNITNNANELTKLDESLVREIRSIRGVENTYPVVVASAMVKFPNGKSSPVLLVGSEAPAFIAGPKKEKILSGNLMDLAEDGAVSGDYFDQGTFDNSLDIGKRLEINGKEAFIRLQTRDARGFAGSFFSTTFTPFSIIIIKLFSSSSAMIIYYAAFIHKSTYNIHFLPVILSCFCNYFRNKCKKKPRGARAKKLSFFNNFNSGTECLNLLLIFCLCRDSTVRIRIHF